MINIKTRKKKKRNGPKSFDIRFMGEEPEIEHISDENQTEYGKALSWYNYFYDLADAKKTIVKYAKDNIDTEKAEKISSLKDSSIIPTAAWQIKMLENGTTFENKYMNCLSERLDRMANMVQEDDRPRANIDWASKKNIEIRVFVEKEIDNFLETYDDSFSIYDYLNSQNATLGTIGDLVKYFESLRQELIDYPDDFKYLGKKYQKTISWYDKLLDELSRFYKNKKVTRKPRQKKVMTLDKKLSRVRHCQKYDPLMLAGSAPQTIIGCTEVWVYTHTKRKISRLLAEDGKTLDIDGVNIINVHPESVMKNLRKPEEEFKIFSGLGKVDVKKYMETVKATPYYPCKNNKFRTTEDMIILKAFK